MKLTKENLVPKHFKRIELIGLKKEQIYAKAATDIERILGKLPLGKTDLKKNDSTLSFHIKASLVEADLTCIDGAMEFNGNLSLMAIPFRSKIDEMLETERICLVAIDDENKLLGIIGGIPQYDGNVWELHPLAVQANIQKQGIGKRLVEDF